MRGAGTPLAPKSAASEWLRNKADVDFGTWSGLDETGPDKVGVGIFFKKCQDGNFRVVSIVPGSSAFRSGLVSQDDRLVKLSGEMVINWKLKDLREKLHGTPGSLVDLQLMRTDGEVYSLKFTRGSPDFIEFQDRFGVMNAHQVEKLVLQKREEQKKNIQVENSLKKEQAQFAEVQLRRRKETLRENDLRQELERLQRECFEEDRKLDLAQQQLAMLEQKSKSLFTIPAL